MEAINGYKETHFGPLVICSRSQEYMEQQARLTVPTAVIVQPLVPEQIISYLKRLGKPLAAVRAVLQTNAVLAELLTTPLWLNVVILAYRGKTAKDLPQFGSAKEQQQEVFRRYVERMLEQRSEPAPYAPQQMRHWLAFLAGRMHKSSQSVHYIEYLQPDWLASRSAQWYTWLGKYVPGILMGILLSISLAALLPSLFLLFLFDPLRDKVLGGFCGGLLAGLSGRSVILPKPDVVKWKTRVRQIVSPLLLGGSMGGSIGLLSFLTGSDSLTILISGVCYTLGGILLVLILPWQQRSAFSKRNSASKRGKVAQAAGVHLRCGLWVGLIVGLSSGLLDGLLEARSDDLSSALAYGLSVGLGYGLDFGLLGIALSLLLRPGMERVQPREIIVWSGFRLFKILVSPFHLAMTLLVGAFVGFLIFLSDVPSNALSYMLGNPLITELSDALSYGLITGLSNVPSNALGFGLGYWCLIGIYRSLSSTTFEEHRRSVPNQGIRRSGRNGLVLGGVSGIIAFLVYALDRIVSFGIDTTSFPPSSVDLGLGLQETLAYSLNDCLVMGFCIAILAGLLFGGLAYFQHYVLRWLFFREGSMPWRDPQFLEESVKRILLKRVGGGYSFIHPLFQEYFATLE